MKSPRPSMEATVAAVKEQVSCSLNEEVAILHLSTGVYYGLDAVAARIWNLIREPRRVSEIRDALVDEYDVEPARCERDLLALLQELAAAGLIEIRSETPA